MNRPTHARPHLAWGLGVLTTLLVTVLSTLLVPSAASAHQTAPPAGTRSLATLLAADGHSFDHRWNDYDIVDAAVTAVLTAKPTSAVGVLADGSTAVTAFLPTDRAFRILAHDLTGHWYRSEGRVLTALVRAVGVDTIESVLLYHVVPGATIDYRTALRSDGASLTTALTGAGLTVRVLHRGYHRGVSLVDNDPDARDPRVVRPNLDQGNLQIAHGIDRVLRPVDL
jgi:uncharacterized surface protein with fasciclin (FAS1) repeats